MGQKTKVLRNKTNLNLSQISVWNQLWIFTRIYKLCALNLNVALTPFDAILLKWQHVGLCPPGVGLIKYCAMAKALFEVLTRLLPTGDSQVEAWISVIQGDGADGYHLLWTVLTLTLPGFNSNKTPIFPLWQNVRDVTVYAKLVSLYFRLMTKKGTYHTEKEKSLLFLRNIKETTLSGIISSLITSIQSHRAEEFDQEELPLKLHIATLASHITMDIDSVMENEMNLDYRINKSVSMFQNDDADNMDNAMIMYANRTQPARENNRRTPGNGHRNFGNGAATSPAWNPDKDWRCRACGEKGHRPRKCRKLAMAIIMGKFLENRLNAKLIKEIEDAWTKRNMKPIEKDPTYKPTVLMSYVDLTDLTVDQIVRDYDWTNFISDAEPYGDDSYMEA